MPSPIGTRIVVVGTTSSGKSTLAARLAQALGVPFVELDALNWEPNWVSVYETDPDEFARRLAAATAGASWVVAGNYTGPSREAFWRRLETAVWLDLPLPQILYRVITRSWRRWRTHELLWGTNYEHFGKHLRVWNSESLIYWALETHRRRRRQTLADMADPRLAHIRFVRLTSSSEVEAFTRSVEEACRLPS